MLIVHGTAAFRDRVPHEDASDATSTTTLGSWYAHLVRWKRPLTLFVNERTLLPLVVPLAPAKTLLARLPDAVAEVMTALDIPADFIAAEVAAMREVQVAPTANRSVLAVLKDGVQVLGYWRDLEESPLELSMRLADRPAGSRDYASPADLSREAAGMPRRVRTWGPPPKLPEVPDTVFPASITGPDGQRIEIRRQWGLADQMMQEMKPLLLADGIDLDDPDNPPALADLQAALDRAVERRNLELFTPIGARRDAAATFLMQFGLLIAEGADALAAALLARVQPEAKDDEAPEVSAVIGAALDLLDGWLTGRAQGVPQHLAPARLPPGWRREAKSATEVLALAGRGRAFSSCGALIARQGGERVLVASALAVAAAAQAWSQKTGRSMDELLPAIVR